VTSGDGEAEPVCGGAGGVTTRLKTKGKGHFPITIFNTFLK